jgi:ferredoxin/truncated hemoglobin YjbI
MQILFGQNKLNTLADETVLQALTRQGIAIRSSCRGGVCQTCLMRCLTGEIPARAQSGLSAELLSKRYFMPCVCKPATDMVLAEPDADDFFVTALLTQRIDDDLGTLYLFEPMSALATPLTELIVIDDQGQRARYPLANKPEQDYYYGIHIAHTDHSMLASGWRHALQEGGQIRMRAALANEQQANEAVLSTPAERPKDPPPDPELWAALDNGVLLRKIIEEFYVRVYEDSQLKSFFVGFTQDRLVEKQYSFLQQVITGNKVYFGNRPLKTHHWMVISDALLDHREQIMLDCIHAHGIEDKWVQRWMALEEFYRPDIVKTEPFPLQHDGVDIPLEGFEELVMDIGAMCDGCGGVVESGETVRYHVRKGTIFCPRCNTAEHI